MTPATSSATAEKSSSELAPCATSVATRRNAACSAAKVRSSSRAWALAIAVAASSVKAASRAWVPAGSGPRVDTTASTPHSRSSTLTGAPTVARMPDSRIRVPVAPAAVA